MDLDSVLEDILRSRGQGNLILKPKQKEALQSIVFKGQDCLTVLPTGGSCLLWVMSTEISVDIAVDIAIDTRSIVGRHSVDSPSTLDRQSVDTRSTLGR